MRDRYSKDLDILIALISNLAHGFYSRKTAARLAADLSISEDTIERVLRSYKSLFNQEPNNEPDEKGAGPYLYSLHLRCALQLQEREDGATSRDPLAPQHVTTLINFVTRAAADERALRAQLVVAVLAAIAVVGAAIIALFK